MNKVLVVDDDQDILQVVKIVLSMNDFEVTTISRGEEIEAAIKTFTPDLILLDVALGSVDGRDICKTLKISHETQHIPVILFSAHYDLANNIQECMANDFVIKPFDTSYLVDKIRKNIN
jgi:DNA-binding response OmpR family regulator